MDTTLCALSPPSWDECALRCGAALFELAIAIVCLVKTPVSLALLKFQDICGLIIHSLTTVIQIQCHEPTTGTSSIIAVK